MRLFDFILENMEVILKEWENFAREIQPPEGKLEVSELRDHAEAMLRAMAADMQTPQTVWERSGKSKGNKPKQAGHTAAETHAGSRLASGFSINLLAAEYRALRASVLELWLWEQGGRQPEEIGDLIRFNEAIDQALAEALGRYSEIVLMEQNIFLGILGGLRTSLQSISHGAEYLKHAGDMDSKYAQLGARMLHGAKRMAGMIDNLLDFTQSRISGGIPIAPTETDLSDVAEQVVAELRSNNPDHIIHCEIKGDCKGHWDAGRVARVYQTLIGNALQYGDRAKGVTVTSEGGPAEAVIRIHNDGPPIPEQERLFDVLHRHSAARDRNLDLGLYIVRKIVSAHCGTITVTSTGSGGTDFVVRLPKDPAAACRLEPDPSRVARGKDGSDNVRLH